MGGTHSCVLLNNTNFPIELEAWLAGYHDHTRKHIYVEEKIRETIQFNTPPDHSCFQINTIIVKIRPRATTSDQFDQPFAFRAFKCGKSVRVSSEDGVHLQLHVYNETLCNDIWNGNQNSFKTSKAQMQNVAQMIGIASKIGVGLTNQVVRTTMQAAGSGSIISFMGGQIASNIVELGLKTAFDKTELGEKPVEEVVEESLKKAKLSEIQTLLIAICRQIQFIYVPMTRSTNKEQSDHLKSLLKELLSVFSTGCNYGIMPYLENLKEYQITFPLYLNAVSIHLLLLNEMAMFLVTDEEYEIAKQCVLSYLNAYLKNAGSLWENIIEEENEKMKVSDAKKLLSMKSYARVKYENNVVYKVSGFNREQVMSRAEDIRDAYFYQQRYILNQKFNYPEKTFETWRGLFGTTENQTVTTQQPMMNFEEIVAKFGIS